MLQKSVGVFVLAVVLCSGVVKYVGVKTKSRLQTMIH